MLEECIADVDRLYARMGGLRDVAGGAEKNPFNNCRGYLHSMRGQLTLLQDQINNNGRGEMKLGDWVGDAVLKQP